MVAWPLLFASKRAVLRGLNAFLVGLLIVQTLLPFSAAAAPSQVPPMQETLASDPTWPPVGPLPEDIVIQPPPEGALVLAPPPPTPAVRA